MAVETIIFLNKNKHFKIFVDECKKWIKYFGLTDIKVFFDFGEHNGSRATCTTNVENAASCLTLCREWSVVEGENLEEAIRLSAFHEVFEMILGRYHAIAIDRFTTEEELESERHRVIRIMENTIYNEKNKLIKKEKKK